MQHCSALQREKITTLGWNVLFDISDTQKFCSYENIDLFGQYEINAVKNKKKALGQIALTESGQHFVNNKAQWDSSIFKKEIQMGDFPIKQLFFFHNDLAHLKLRAFIADSALTALTGLLSNHFLFNQEIKNLLASIDLTLLEYVEKKMEPKVDFDDNLICAIVSGLPVWTSVGLLLLCEDMGLNTCTCDSESDDDGDSY